MIRTIAAILISTGIIYGIVVWKQAADREAILVACFDHNWRAVEHPIPDWCLAFREDVEKGAYVWKRR